MKWFLVVEVLITDRKSKNGESFRLFTCVVNKVGLS